MSEESKEDDKASVSRVRSDDVVSPPESDAPDAQDRPISPDVGARYPKGMLYNATRRRAACGPIQSLLNSTGSVLEYLYENNMQHFAAIVEELSYRASYSPAVANEVSGRRNGADEPLRTES